MVLLHWRTHPLSFHFSIISLKSGVGSQLWLIGLGMPLPSLEAHVYVAGN